jgi:hypothetical protein
MRFMTSKREILAQISAIRKTDDIDTAVALLRKLNASLPEVIRLKLPTMFTSSYVRSAAGIIEEQIIDSEASGSATRTDL